MLLQQVGLVVVLSCQPGRKGDAGPVTIHRHHHQPFIFRKTWISPKVTSYNLKSGGGLRLFESWKVLNHGWRTIDRERERLIDNKEAY